MDTSVEPEVKEKWITGVDGKDDGMDIVILSSCPLGGILLECSIFW